MTNIKDRLESIVKKGTLKANEPLSGHTTMKIGGPAQFFVKATETEEIRNLLILSKDEGIPLFILGGGSNVIFADSGYPGIVLKLDQAQYRTEKKGTEVEVTFPSGYNSHLASVKMAEELLSGFEPLYGLPGTIGGAIYMNSKWPKDNFQTSDALSSVTYLDESGEVKRKTAPEIKFGYGYSKFQEHPWIILEAVFRFKPGDKNTIADKNSAIMAYRRQTQPFGVSTAGCVFKNILEEEKERLSLPNTSAGYLIDQCGLKNKQIGKVHVSPIHANFFVNLGGATAQDYLSLVELVREKVQVKFGLDLREEVQFVK